MAEVHLKINTPPNLTTFTNYRKMSILLNKFVLTQSY